MFRSLAVLVLSLAGTAAQAHPGDHAGLDLVALAGHIFEPDHVIFAGLAVLVGLLSYRAGRRAEVRAGRRTEVRTNERNTRQ